MKTKNFELLAYDKDNDVETSILDFSNTPIEDVLYIGRKINEFIVNENLRTDEGQPYDWLTLAIGDRSIPDLVFNSNGGLEFVGKESNSIVKDVKKYIENYEKVVEIEKQQTADEMER